MTMTSSSSQYELERNKPMPSKNHSRIQRRLNVVLTPYEDRFDFMPELSLQLSTGDAVPDLCIYPKLEFDFEQDEIKMTEVPITTIEILSPKQVLDDVVSKIRNTYFPSGVQSSWLILPSLHVIHLLMPDKTIASFSSGTLTDPATDIQIDVDKVFS